MPLEFKIIVVYCSSIKLSTILMVSVFVADILVCLVTMDAESFGTEALSEVQILEKRIPTAKPATPKPQPVPTPGYYFDIIIYGVQAKCFVRNFSKII